MKYQTQVLVIGGGLTGAGVLRDLALRGVECMLVERKDIDAGASGANHGLLHSGGRYAVADPDSARECVAENAILKRVASGCIEETGGLFVGLPDDDERYAEDFLAAAGRVGLSAEEIDTAEALELEPRLNPEIVRAIRVPDGAINPFMATVANLADAEVRGAKVLLHTQVTSMRREGERVTRVVCLDNQTGREISVEAEQIISAAGPWVDKIGAMAGIEIPITYSKGSLLVTNSRLTDHVINRLHPADNGDIIVPAETVTITGTTSIRVQNLDHLTTGAAEVDLLLDCASKLMPSLSEARIIRVYAGVRPLVTGSGEGSDRGLSRTFSVFDHEQDGLHNLATITGGKLTTYRLMAERVVDLVCGRLGLDTPCSTHREFLPGSGEGRSLDARHRMERLAAPPPGGEVLCECEMVSRQYVDGIAEQLRAGGHPIDPTSLRLRSRLGMGACQGGFCGFRAVGYLHQTGELSGSAGNEGLIRFLERRWGGIRPVLWGEQLRQEQLLEALYCGTLNIDGDL
jgi:glycerol-3-phosphate dehydrogenase